MVVIKKCVCENSFQDKTYGNGMRVFNTCGAEGKKARCSCCHREMIIKEEEKKKNE